MWHCRRLMSLLVNCLFLVGPMWLSPTLAQPTYVYDGVSTVQVEGAENNGNMVYNWTLKYPVGALCEDPNWVTTLIINVTAITAQADLSIAFGSQTTYLALLIPYDGKMWKSIQTKELSGLSVVPAPGKDLITATTTLEQQYATDTDYRKSIIPSKDPEEWYIIYDCCDKPMSNNADQLILRLFGDRVNDLTHLTVTKNGESVQAQFTSTWDYRSTVYLYMGMDAAVGQKEIFEISGIQRTDECTIQTLPTQPTTTTLTPTLHPTQPSFAPTRITNAPTQMSLNPTGTVTQSPLASPTVFPSISPIVSPSLFPTKTPTKSTKTPSASTMDFTVLPSKLPTKAPSVKGTMLLTKDNGSVIDETEDDDDGVIEVDSDDKEEAQPSFLDGFKDGNIYIWIGIGILGLYLLIAILFAVYFCVKKAKKRGVSVPNDETPFDDW
eukprot:227650_1